MNKTVVLILALAESGQAVAMDTIDAQRVTMQSGQMYDLMMSRFTQADADKSNALGRKEAEKMPRVAAHFDEIARNHDGQISLQELQAAFVEKL